VLIVVTLWDEHAENVLQFKEGDIVLLKNVHPRIDNHGRLELYMHGKRDDDDEYYGGIEAC
jgi:hypothetical protein